MRTLAVLLAFVVLTVRAVAMDEQLVDPQGARWRLIKADDGSVLAISMTLAKHYRKYAVVSACRWDPAIANCEHSSILVMFDCRGRSLIPGDPEWVPLEPGTTFVEVERILCALPVERDPQSAG
jgi:hypothetical protein